MRLAEIESDLQQLVAILFLLRKLGEQPEADPHKHGCPVAGLKGEGAFKVAEMAREWGEGALSVCVKLLVTDVYKDGRALHLTVVDESSENKYARFVEQAHALLRERGLRPGLA